MRPGATSPAAGLREGSDEVEGAATRYAGEGARAAIRRSSIFGGVGRDGTDLGEGLAHPVGRIPSRPVIAQLYLGGDGQAVSPFDERVGR